MSETMVSDTALAQEAEAADGEPKRTDPRTFIVHTLGLLPQMVLPLGAVAFTMREDISVGVPVLAGLAALIVFLNLFFTYLGWRRFTYRVGDSDIRVESGILSRAARSVPYDRIQDVSLEQAFVPRIFGLTSVRFETGAGGSEEIALTYLKNEEGARLRELVRERRDEAEGAATPASLSEAQSEDAELLFEMGPKRLFTFGLFEFSLALVAFLGAAAQQFEFLLPFDLWDVETWQRLVVGQTDRIAELGPIGQALGAVAAVVSLLLVGLVTGVVRTFLRDWGFRLERNPKGFRRRRGLLTRTDVVMPVHRVQAIKVTTGIVRHRFGWKALRLVSLAQDSGNASHVVAPFAQASELTPILKTSGFPLPPRGLDWQRTTGSYRLVSAIFGALGYAVLSTIAVQIVQNLSDPRFDWIWFVAVFFGALSIFTAIQQIFLWRAERHALSGTHIYQRLGWLAPGYSIGDRVKVQTVEIKRGPIGRLFGYVTLHLGVAGGSFSISGIRHERAVQLRWELLSSMVEKDFSRLI